MTTTSVVQQVRNWYDQHSAQLFRKGAQSSIRSMADMDTQGKVEIRVETDLMLVSITFWNHGSVSVLSVNKESKAERVLDDRSLREQDNVPLLLDKYLQEIIVG